MTVRAREFWQYSYSYVHVSQLNKKPSYDRQTVNIKFYPRLIIG